jgi:uncharacterized protein (DUF1778 family)
MKIKDNKKVDRIDIGLRMLPMHAEEISRAAQVEAHQKGITASRNDFCAAAALAAARKVLAENER